MRFHYEKRKKIICSFSTLIFVIFKVFFLGSHLKKVSFSKKVLSKAFKISPRKKVTYVAISLPKSFTFADNLSKCRFFRILILLKVQF